MSESTQAEAVTQQNPLLRFVLFCVQIAKSFFSHNGLLLASAMAYNLLLSIVPLGAVLLVTLSQFFERQWLFNLLDGYLVRWLPEYGKIVSEQIQGLVANPQVFGGLGLIVMIFFSSMAFSVTERAMQEIFSFQGKKPKSKAWLSLILPFVFILTIGLGLVLLSVVSVGLDHFSTKGLTLWGKTYSLAAATRIFLYIFGFLGTSLLVAFLYMIMPGGEVSFRAACWGGLSAAILWEIVRRVMTWYFAKISMVGVIYGSLGTVIVILLSFEVAAIIFLLGAEVIAALSQKNSALLDAGHAQEDKKEPAKSAA